MVQAPPKPKQQTGSSGTAVTAAPIVVRLPSGFLTDEMLIEISNLNDAWRFERNTEGALEISVPTGSIGGSRSMHVAGQLYAWWSTHEEGMVFDSSTGFRLPGDSVRSPDSAWASSHSVQDMQPDDEGYWKICPDFVVEVVSAGQESQKQQEKMLGPVHSNRVLCQSQGTVWRPGQREYATDRRTVGADRAAHADSTRQLQAALPTGARGLVVHHEGRL